MRSKSLVCDQEQFVSSSDACIWTNSSGNGIPLLMFNGGPGCNDYLAPVAALMNDFCRVIRFEARGCGRSDWDGDYSIETLIQDAESIRRAYSVDRWIVAGHSFGPDLALAYALRYPRHVIGLIGIAGGRIVNDRTWHSTYRNNLARVGEDLGGVTFTVDPRVNSDCTQSWREYIQRPTLLREIATLEVPASFIYGTNDIRPAWPTRQLATLLPNGQFVEIQGAAHSIWLTHPTELQMELNNAVIRIRGFGDTETMRTPA